MRPRTLSEALQRIKTGTPDFIALPEFLDTFYTRPGPEAREECLRDEPPLTGDERLDALAGAIAEYLSHKYRLRTAPAWIFDERRFLREPWHTTAFDSPEMREYLTWTSPAEFRSRNIFTDEMPLRRARMPR